MTNEEFPPTQSSYNNIARSQSTERSEILAQSICTALAGPNNWVFAVERLCSTPDSCEDICTSDKLHAQAPQIRIRDSEWRAISQMHIYDRPLSGPSTAADPHLGQMIYRHANVNFPAGNCGPNYCCCAVAYSGPV